MAYDEDLANRVRGLVGTEEGLTEKRMFGGLAFLINGNMAVTASSTGGLMVRVDREQADEFLEEKHTETVVMRGRPMRGWLRVAPEGLRSERDLKRWVRRGIAYARSLPPK